MASDRIAAQPVRDTFGSPLYALVAATIACLAELGSAIAAADAHGSELCAIHPKVPLVLSAIASAHTDLESAHGALRVILTTQQLRASGDIPAALVAELAPRNRAGACLRCDAVPCECPPLHAPECDATGCAGCVS